MPPVYLWGPKKKNARQSGRDSMKVILASDHAGFEMKEAIKRHLLATHVAIEDVGTQSTDSVSWVEYGAKAARLVSEHPDEYKGILVCGTGGGMSIVANKFRHVRAILANDPAIAVMGRKHNNANVLNLGGRVVDETTALHIVDAFLQTDFEGGRHQTRLDYLADVVEAGNFK
jgi:ribose 5-phosphate isomerase B